jgi:GTP:adenosylcobinamide-phosphate guanylyltransferase
MDCLIMAGGRPSIDDSLYRYSKGRPKALINIAGKAMIAWILEAMIDAKSIESIIVVGIDKLPEFADSVEFLPDEGTLIDNVLSGLSWVLNNRPAANSLLFSSSDIPTITGSIVDQITEECSSSEYAIYYPMVPKESMLSRFPSSNRTFVKLSDLEAAGGDLIVVHRQAFDIDLEIWRSITNARKYPWKIARIVGITTLVKLLTRRLSLAEATRKGEELIGHPVKAHVTDIAEIAMDVDKPEQLLVVSEELRKSQELP